MPSLDFLMVYPVRNTTALATISTVENGSFLLESRNESSMIDVLILSKQSSSTEPKNLELL